MKRGVLIILFLILTILWGCRESDIVLITNNKTLLLPVKASIFSGFYSKEKLSVDTDFVHRSNELIRFLNFSKYNTVITDEETASFLEKSSKNWITLCTVAIKEPSVYLLKKLDSKIEKSNRPIYALKRIKKFIPKEKLQNVILIDNLEELLKKPIILHTEVLPGYEIVRTEGKIEYKLLIRRKLLSTEKLIVKFVRGWNYGIDLLKDPAVLEVVSSELQTKLPSDLKLLKCGAQ